MGYNDDFFEEDNEEDNKFPLATAIVISLLTAALIIGIVLIFNRDNISFLKGKQNVTENNEYTGYIDLDEYISGSKLTSDELDIWDEYLDEPETEDEIQEDNIEESKPEETDLSQGGTKTKIIKDDGSEIWVNINKYINPNNLDNASFMLKNGRLAYYKDGEKISYDGIIVDKNDDYVDFGKVKRDGIDFVLIRIGQRGYSTGNITIDENFQDNLKNAKDAGLHVGVLFSSQAITVEEAEEEAQFVIDTLGEQTIDYPVCFYMDYVDNDKARVENIMSEQKSIIAKAFMNKIEANGMNTILYGDKEWLLCNLNYTSVAYYDILLDQEEDLPDFPYRFTMWKYSTKDVSGVSGKSEMIISLVDYSVK